jgi:hypothetical protein
VDFALAATAFVLIWLIVAVGGVRDLRHLFRDLEDEQRRD